MEALLERDSELDALLEATAEAARGSGVVALVHGEPGAGKTSLVRAYLRRLVPGTRLFVGACDDLITPRALGPLRDAVRWRGGPLADALGADRDDVFDALIAELAHPRDVTVLVVEDAHWADDATLDVLQFVLRRIGTLRALVVLTYRDDELHPDHPLLPLLSAAAGPSMRRISVPRLSSAAVATLTADSGLDPATVYGVTGGNAFFVTEMIAGATADVPATVVDAVLSRVRQLDEATQRALEQLSVVPNRVEHWLVEELVGGLESLAEAERRGVLQVDRERVAFRHELARRALAQSLPAARRVALNRTIVDALVGAPNGDVARIVHHAVEAGDVETIVAYAPDAAREAARANAHRQALVLFEEVLRHEQQLPSAERARVLGDYSWELYNAHRFRDAVAAAQRSSEIWRELGDPVALGLSLVALSRHRWMCNDSAGAWAAIGEATRVLDVTDDIAALAQAHTFRGAMLALRGDAEEALVQLRHARALAEVADAGGLVSLTLNYEGVALVSLGEEDAGIATLRSALAQAKAAQERDRHHPRRGHTGEQVARAYANLATMLHTTERYDDLRELLPEALTCTEECGFTAHAYGLRARHSALLIRDGQWDAAEAELRALDRQIKEPGSLGRFMLPIYARLLARRAAPDAEQAVMKAIAYGDAAEFRTAPAEATLALLEWAWLNGQPERAAVRVAESLAALDPRREPRLLGTLLRYAQRAGIHEGRPFQGCPETWAAGLRGDWFRSAVEWQRVGEDYERALELAESGDTTVTTEALAILERLGATAAAALVRRRLRDLGARRVPRGPRLATKANPAGLTDRQVDVLRLVAKGLTNAEIADALVVSVRTVDHHVAAVLDKLQIHSRRSVAERAAQLGIG